MLRLNKRKQFYGELIFAISDEIELIKIKWFLKKKNFFADSIDQELNHEKN